MENKKHLNLAKKDINYYKKINLPLRFDMC